YKSLSFQNAEQYGDWTKMFSAARLGRNIQRYFVAARAPNPDPEWYPGWGKIEGGSYYNALLQAASNRTWLPQCQQDYSQYRAAWKQIEAQVRPELERLRQPGNYYLRAHGLTALMAKTMGAAAKAKLLFRDDRHPYATVGIPYEIVRAIFELHSES